MENCNEILYDENCIAICTNVYGEEHSHCNIDVKEMIKTGLAIDISNRPILENGVSYELEISELISISEYIYFCGECNSFHIKNENLADFNKLYL